MVRSSKVTACWVTQLSTLLKVSRSLSWHFTSDLTHRNKTICQEIDGARIFSVYSLELLQCVPASLEKVYAIGSVRPGLWCVLQSCSDGYPQMTDVKAVFDRRGRCPTFRIRGHHQSKACFAVLGCKSERDRWSNGQPIIEGKSLKKNQISGSSFAHRLKASAVAV